MTTLINTIDMNLKFNEHTVKVIGSSENPMFLVKDICNILDIKNISHATSKLPQKYRGIAKNDTLGGTQKVLTVNEAGLYNIVMRSNKPLAQPFQEWVYEEVLPTIRKTGEYKLEEYKKMLEDQNKKISELSDKLTEEQKSTNKVKKSLLTVQKKFTQRYKFPVMGCVYILHDSQCIFGKYKIGFTDNINNRLAQDRTMVPDIQVDFIYYTPNYELFEKIILLRWCEHLELPSHEWVFASLEDIIQSYRDINKVCRMNAVEEKNLWRYNMEEPPKELLLKNIESEKTKQKHPKNIPKFQNMLEEKLVGILPTRILRHDYRKKTDDAPDGQRYCNGFCQIYQPLISFNKHISSYMTICRCCEGMVDVAMARLDQGLVTKEQIRKNPSILTMGVRERLCKKCNQILDQDLFEPKKRQCRKCRQSARSRHEGKFDDVLESEIEILKNLEGNEEELKIKLGKYIKRELCKIISYLELGRKYNDKKDQLVEKLLEYFNSPK